jgi:hypothetical protein
VNTLELWDHPTDAEVEMVEGEQFQYKVLMKKFYLLNCQTRQTLDKIRESKIDDALHFRDILIKD